MQQPTEDPMPSLSLRTELLKWVVAALLAATLVGVAAMAYWLPVQGYSVTCKKSELISCELERRNIQRLPDLAGSTRCQGHRHRSRVKPRRRRSSRVLLYLNSSSQAVFAAEFEGGAAVAQAEAAAAEL